MNTLYGDATPEELQAADNVCIICREEMMTASKKLPCNHIFHTACLRSWFQRQQTCPTCRLNILRTTPNPRTEQRPRVQPIPNPFAGPLPFINPFQPLLNQNAQAPVPEVNQPVPPPPPTAPPSSTAPNVNQQTTVPPFTMPPFMPFPFLPFMSPPPMPPSNFRTLSMDELKRMEGNERENVEARIRCLQNIQVMLDAAMLMMNQYSAAAATSTSMASVSEPTTPSSESVPNTPNDSPNIIANKESYEASVSNASSSVTIGTNSIVSNHTASSSTSEPSTDLSPEEELRRRRLQRFQQPVEQQQ